MCYTNNVQEQQLLIVIQTTPHSSICHRLKFVCIDRLTYETNFNELHNKRTYHNTNFQ